MGDRDGRIPGTRRRPTREVPHRPVAGAEVVQIYVRDVASSVARPVRELRGFTKITLDPGRSREVMISLDQRAFAFWSERHGTWVVEAGEFAVEAGHHSRNLPLTRTVTVGAPPIADPLTAGSTLHEWMADPVGLELIREPSPPVSPIRPATPSSSRSSRSTARCRCPPWPRSRA